MRMISLSRLVRGIDVDDGERQIVQVMEQFVLHVTSDVVSLLHR